MVTFALSGFCPGSVKSLAPRYRPWCGRSAFAVNARIVRISPSTTSNVATEQLRRLSPIGHRSHSRACIYDDGHLLELCLAFYNGTKRCTVAWGDLRPFLLRQQPITGYYGYTHFWTATVELRSLVLP